MRRKHFLLSCLIGLLALFSFSTAAFAATWSSSDQYASWSSGGYTVYNNVWGSGAGPQTIWANSGSNWGVWSQQPNTGGIKSYPNSDKDIGVRLSSLSSVSSSFNVTSPTSNVSYESAYDIWADGYNYEIMLWMNHYGSVKPISYNWDSSGNPVPVYTNVYLGGHTWNVYRGSNGSNDVFSFVRTSNTSSGTVDVLSVLNWIKGRGWYGDVTLSKVQFGFEITSSPNGENFNCNSYSVSYSTGSSGGGSGSYVKLANRGTGLDLDGMGRTSNGSTVGQYSSGSSYNQQWVIETDGSYVRIKNRATGLYVDGMGRTTNGDAAGQWSNSNSANQEWQEISVSGGYVEFKNLATGLYLDGMGRTSNGSDCGQYSYSGSNNQQWQIVTP